MSRAKPQPVGSWLATYAKQNTRRVLRAGVKHFLESAYGKVEDLEGAAATYMGECRAGRDWFKDLLKYAADLHGRPPKSARAFMAAVKSWLEYSLDVELTRRQARQLIGRLPKGSRASTEELELTREVLRAVLTHGDVKARALILFLASSGVRVGEALLLRLGDVNLNVGPPEVHVRGEYTKSGNKYVSFLTGEAREALVEWLKVRGDYLASAANRGKGLGRIKSVEDERLFPFSPRMAEQIWQNCIVKAKLAEKDGFTRRHKLHIHMLRKYFLSQAKIAVPENVAEAWAGHSGYLDDAYRRYSMQQLREFYRKAEPYLIVNMPVDNSLILENQTLRDRLEKAERLVEKLEKQLQDLK